MDVIAAALGWYTRKGADERRAGRENGGRPRGSDTGARRGAGWSEETVRAHLKTRYGFDHSEDVTRDKYEAVCRDLAAARQPGMEG